MLTTLTSVQMQTYCATHSKYAHSYNHIHISDNAYSIEHQQRCRDSACADFVIQVGRYKALVQRKRMRTEEMKAVFVCERGEAEMEVTAVQRTRVRL